MPDVIVVGAEGMGAALARYLSRAGASVVVVDQNEVGGGTSSATFSIDITLRNLRNRGGLSSQAPAAPDGSGSPGARRLRGRIGVAGHPA